MNELITAVLAGFIATILASPIYALIVMFTIRRMDARQRQTLRFLKGEWHSAYETNHLPDPKWAIEKVRIRENLLHNKVIVESIESDPSNLMWFGELQIDRNLTAFGTWHNINNPARNGYCIFHITRDDNLVGFQSTAKYDHTTRRFRGHWILCKDKTLLDKQILITERSYDK